MASPAWPAPTTATSNRSSEPCSIWSVISKLHSQLAFPALAGLPGLRHSLPRARAESVSETRGSGAGLELSAEAAENEAARDLCRRAYLLDTYTVPRPEKASMASPSSVSACVSALVIRCCDLRSGPPTRPLRPRQGLSCCPNRRQRRGQRILTRPPSVTRASASTPSAQGHCGWRRGTAGGPPARSQRMGRARAGCAGGTSCPGPVRAGGEPARAFLVLTTGNARAGTDGSWATRPATRLECTRAGSGLVVFVRVPPPVSWSSASPGSRPPPSRDGWTASSGDGAVMPEIPAAPPPRGATAHDFRAGEAAAGARPSGGLVVPVRSSVVVIVDDQSLLFMRR